jgi:hypothetical protein
LCANPCEAGTIRRPAFHRRWIVFHQLLQEIDDDIKIILIILSILSDLKIYNKIHSILAGKE